MAYAPQNGGLPNGQSSVMIVNPPTDNYNSNGNSSSQYYENGGNGTMTSYGNPTMMITNMVHQMMTIAQNNRELKESIRQNNQGFQTKLFEFQKWKDNWKIETTKIHQHYKNARTMVFNLRQDKVMLETENTKLKIHLSSKTKSSDNEDCLEEENLGLLPDDIHSKTLATIENLEKQLKVSLSEKDELEKEKENVEKANQQLQRMVHSNQNIFHKYESDAQELKRVNQALLTERERVLPIKQDLETRNKELTAQLLNVLEESKSYETKLKQSNAAAEKLKIENKDLQTRLSGIKDTIAKVKKEKQTVQNRLESELQKLQSQYSDKSNSFEHLFLEYDCLRVENEQLKSQHSLQNLDEMYSRLLCADESLQKKDRELKDLEERCKTEKRQAEAKLKKSQEDMEFFKAQADVYKSDFLIERDDRSKLHEQNQKHRNLLFERERDMDQLKKKLEQMQLEMMRR